MPISSPYCIIGVPGSENSRLNASSSCRRSLPSIGASRRRMPRSYSCMRFSGPNASNTFWRCSSVSRPRSSSSWLRRNCTHCALARTLRASASSAQTSGSMSAGGQRVEQPLVDREVQHHLQAVAFVAEVLRCSRRAARSLRPAGSRRRQRHCRKSRISFSRLKSMLVLDAGALLLDQERHGVHAESGDAELQPEAHDLLDLGAHVRVPGVQVGLVVVEAVEVVLARLSDRTSTSSSARRGRRCPPCGSSAARRPRRTSRGRATCGSLRACWNHGRVDRRVVDDQVDDDADAERLGVVHELDEVAERAVLARARCSSR